MNESKIYDLFISHAWNLNEEYSKLIEYLDKAIKFSYKNHGKVEHDALIDPNSLAGKATLSNNLDRQIRPANCVLILVGMHAENSEWIEKEMKIASGYFKPIIGIRARGQDNVPWALESKANVMVNWNKDAILAAIKKYTEE